MFPKKKNETPTLTKAERAVLTFHNKNPQTHKVRCVISTDGNWMKRRSEAKTLQQLSADGEPEAAAAGQ